MLHSPRKSGELGSLHFGEQARALPAKLTGAPNATCRYGSISVCFVDSSMSPGTGMSENTQCQVKEFINVLSLSVLWIALHFQTQISLNMQCKVDEFFFFLSRSVLWIALRLRAQVCLKIHSVTGMNMLMFCLLMHKMKSSSTSTQRTVCNV